VTTRSKAPENPILVRLTRRYQRQSRWRLAAAALIIVLAWIAFFSADGNLITGMAAFVASTISIVVPLATLFALASLAANLPADYMRSQEYELVSATPLSNAAWINGYVRAVLRRSQLGILLAAGLLPLASLSLLTTSVVYLIAPGYTITLEWLAHFAYSVVTAEVLMLGLFYWVVSLGVTCAVRLRYAAPATLTAVIVPTSVVFVGVRIGQAITDALFGTGNVVVVEAAWHLLLAVALFGLAWLTQLTGERWAPGAPRAK
jgi:hypothetical protein